MRKRTVVLISVLVLLFGSGAYILWTGHNVNAATIDEKDVLYQLHKAKVHFLI